MISPILIKENMEVLSSDGVHIGTVHRVEGADEVRLAGDSNTGGGKDHSIPLSWVVHVEMKVHLNRSSDEVEARWTSH
jgi:hypothetical protein